MKRVISSKRTFFLKFIFPIFIPFFVIFLLSYVNYAIPVAIKVGSSLLFVGFFIVFHTLVLIYSVYTNWYSTRLKKITVFNNSLLISNYFKEIEIPFSEVDEITENFWNSIHPITLHLKNPTEFGRKIIFLPIYCELPDFSTSHPIVGELREIIRN